MIINFILPVHWFLFICWWYIPWLFFFVKYRFTFVLLVAFTHFYSFAFKNFLNTKSKTNTNWLDTEERTGFVYRCIFTFRRFINTYFLLHLEHFIMHFLPLIFIHSNKLYHIFFHVGCLFLCSLFVGVRRVYFVFSYFI